VITKQDRKKEEVVVELTQEQIGEFNKLIFSMLGKINSTKYRGKDRGVILLTSYAIEPRIEMIEDIAIFTLYKATIKLDVFNSSRSGDVCFTGEDIWQYLYYEGKNKYDKPVVGKDIYDKFGILRARKGDNMYKYADFSELYKFKEEIRKMQGK